MKSNRLDQFTIVATILGFGVDLSTVGGWARIDGVCSGSSDKPGLVLALLSFYSLTLVSFITRRLLYRYRANQRKISYRDVPITQKENQDTEAAVLYITCLTAGIVLWPPILEVDWIELQFDLSYYTIFNETPLIFLVTMFILLIVAGADIVASQIYSFIVGVD
jgi:hypothetical protein